MAKMNFDDKHKLNKMMALKTIIVGGVTVISGWAVVNGTLDVINDTLEDSKLISDKVDYKGEHKFKYSDILIPDENEKKIVARMEEKFNKSQKNVIDSYNDWYDKFEEDVMK